MPIATIITGGILSLLGVIGFVFSESRSLTALIPLIFGTMLELCGALALRPEFKKHAMHGAAVIGLVGVLGAAPGALTFLKLITGTDVARPLAAKVQAAMFVTCAVFLVLCIRSFQEARARRNSASA
jgi:uncharacterized membrane protein HdeD (DUF308 family)